MAKIPKSRTYRGDRYELFGVKAGARNAAYAEAERLRTLGHRVHVKKFGKKFAIYIT